MKIMYLVFLAVGIVLNLRAQSNFIVTDIYNRQSQGIKIIQHKNNDFRLAQFYFEMSGEIGLSRLDSTGQVTIRDIFVHPSFEYLTDLYVDESGNNFLLGSSSSFVPGVQHVFLIKTDSLGNIEWEHIFGSSILQTARKIIPTHDNNYYLLAETLVGKLAVNVIKISPDGNLIWSKTYRNSFSVRPFGFATTHNSKIIVVGNGVDESDSVPKPVILQFSEQGDIENEMFCDSYQENFYSIDHVSKNLYALRGQNSIFLFDQRKDSVHKIHNYPRDINDLIINNQNEIIFISRGSATDHWQLTSINIKGVILWQNEWEIPEHSEITSISNALDNGFILTGSIRDQVGKLRAVTIKTDCQGNIDYYSETCIPVTPTTYSLEIGPNPIQDELVVNIQDSTNSIHNVKLYNSLGQIVYAKTFQQSGSQTIDMNSLSNGIYFCQYWKEGGPVSTIRLVKAK